jgi:hypothetical protein
VEGSGFNTHVHHRERGFNTHVHHSERGLNIKVQHREEGFKYIPLKYALNRSTPCCRSATPIISRMLCMDSWGMPVRE